MQRRMASLVWAVAAASVCAGVVGTVRADTQETKADKPASPRVGWGEPKDGLQIGLFPQSGQKTFRYGDTIALVMRARNVGKTPIALNVKPPNVSSVTLGENGTLVLQTLGGGGSSVLLQIAPGETQDLPGGHYSAQILAPEEIKERVAKADPALALLPGKYQVECSFHLWMPDQNDPNRATAHRARPGIFAFTVQNDRANPPVPLKDKEADDSFIWGEAVNGLQGGLRRLTDKDLAELPEGSRKEIAKDEILTRFYVRNVTDKPIRVSYHNFADYDASFWIKDAQGQDHMVQSTFFTGVRALSQQTLQPGEKAAAGWGRLELMAQETPPAQRSNMPLLAAKPGQYTMRLISSVRFTGLNHFDMVLVSGAMPFTIPPQ